MRLVPLRRTKCGADIVDYTEGAGVVRCSALGCGATFLLEQGKSFAKSNAIEVKAIANLRKNLAFYQSMRNYQQLADTANAVLKLVPEDFLAQFYARLAEKHIGDPRGYRAFLENPPSATPDEYEEAARSVLEQLEIDEEPYAVRYLQKAIPDRDSQMEWTGALTKAVETLRQKADHYALYPRDVFISYSHFDVALARQVVQCLEGDGVSCWVSYRNLANADNENYWHAIRYAIEHCKAFLVICSERAMYSKDVQRELNIAEEARSQPKRLEIKADGKEHTTLFKFFFDGCSWLDAKTVGPDFWDALKVRMYGLMRQKTTPAAFAQPPAPVPVSTPLPKTEPRRLGASANPSVMQSILPSAPVVSTHAQEKMPVSSPKVKSPSNAVQRANFWQSIWPGKNSGEEYGVPSAKDRKPRSSSDMAKKPFLAATTNQASSKQDENSSWLLRDAEKEYQLGVCYFNGAGREKSDAKAAECYRIAALQGHVQAQYALGYCYETGKGVPQSADKAAEWYEKAAQNGHVIAQYNLGLLYFRHGRATAEEARLSKHWMTLAARQGYTMAKQFINENGLASSDNDNAPVNTRPVSGGYPERRTSILHSSSISPQEKGDAQYLLGQAYSHGAGGAKNDLRAVEYYRKAAELGHVQAQYVLGHCYENGEGVAKNMNLAAEWYEKAARNGHVIAQYNIGLLSYANGFANAQGKKAAKAWMTQAAEHGYTLAKIFLQTHSRELG